MDILSIALDRVKFEINPEVLELAFAPRRYNPAKQNFTRENRSGVSTDAMIRRAIIDARVMVDINLCSGVENVVSLNGLPVERIDPWSMIYRIPKERTGGRTITAVYSLSFGQGSVLGTSYNGTSDSSAALDAAAGVLQSNMPWTQVQTAFVSLIGENTVLVSNMGQQPGALYLRCQVTHEPNLANIAPENYDVFTELVILAAKAYVYNNTIVSLDEGAIKAGASIGRIREIIDGYADSNQLYKEHMRDNWRVVAHMNDREKNKRHMRYTVGARR
jgi:hypothetical protein